MEQRITMWEGQRQQRAQCISRTLEGQWNRGRERAAAGGAEEAARGQVIKRSVDQVKSSGCILSNGKDAKDFSCSDMDWKERKVETGI